MPSVTAWHTCDQGRHGIVGITGGIAMIALDATTVAAQRGPLQTSPLFEEAGPSAANDG